MKANELLDQLEATGTGQEKIKAVRALRPKTAEDVVHCFVNMGHFGTVEKACKIAGLKIVKDQRAFQSPLVLGPALVAADNKSDVKSDNKAPPG